MDVQVVTLSRFDLDAVVVDLDGVVTDTATVHRRAWARTFDAFLVDRSPARGEDLSPFGLDDYLSFVDGRPRADGVSAFLTSRGVDVPARTLSDLAERKDAEFQRLVRTEGVRVLPGSVALLVALRRSGFGTAVVSASRNCRTVMGMAGVDDLFDEVVDGTTASQLALPGKPHPAVYLEAAGRLGVSPARTAVVEDALSGVEAARRGRFAVVVGVGDARRAPALLAHGADVVVPDLTGVAVGAAPALDLGRT